MFNCADRRELENMAHAGRKLPTQAPTVSRPLILWAEDCVANARPLPEMNAFGLPRKAVAGPYIAPVSFQGATALHLAAFYGHSGVTDLLLAAMACDVSACNAQVGNELNNIGGSPSFTKPGT